jgi:hypothetical protein
VLAGGLNDGCKAGEERSDTARFMQRLEDVPVDLSNYRL